MKFVAIALFALVAGAYAQHQDSHAEVLRSESAVNPDSFQYAYETSNGISANADGHLKTVGDQSAVTSQGQFKYTSPEGEQVQIQYVADENGYQPTGSLLPVSPPIPVAIARALEYIAAHPQQEKH